MSQYSDVNIIVVSNKKTKFENLDHAKKVFDQAGVKIGGVIVNKAQTKSSSYYSYYTNDYYYNKGRDGNK